MTLDARIGALAELHDLPREAGGKLLRLLQALAAEPSPPTAVSQPADAVDAHLADSLVALDLPAVHGARRLADIGSGAGFPGLPLAIGLPAASVDLVEASGRKSKVIGRLARAADVTNARAVASRAECWGAAAGRETYEVVTARAVASLAVLAEYAAPLLELGGALVAWKGRRDAGEERAAEAAGGRLGLEYAEVVPVRPYAAARDRHLHLLVKRAPTPPQFPRRPGRAVKRPLG